MKHIAGQIIDWLVDYSHKARTQGFVVGVSGGVDSALVSTLCAMTGLKTILVEMPIKRKLSPISERAKRHCNWLEHAYNNVIEFERDLSETFDSFVLAHPDISELAMANLRSRLRMCSLYSFANTRNLLVAGTGNACEDFGVAFFTKYGDGGCDVSPIGDLMKSDVRALAKHLGVSDDIVNAVPTDELWSDTRSDEDQIGASYDELEWAMKEWGSKGNPFHCSYYDTLTDRQRKVMKIFEDRHRQNAHKMQMPPICKIRR